MQICYLLLQYIRFWPLPTSLPLPWSNPLPLAAGQAVTTELVSYFYHATIYLQHISQSDAVSLRSSPSMDSVRRYPWWPTKQYMLPGSYLFSSLMSSITPIDESIAVTEAILCFQTDWAHSQPPMVFTLCFLPPELWTGSLPQSGLTCRSHLTPGLFSDHLCIIATPPPPHPPTLSLVFCLSLASATIWHWLIGLLFVNALKTETIHMDRLHVVKWIWMNFGFILSLSLSVSSYLIFFLSFLICLPCVSFKSFHIFR